MVRHGKFTVLVALLLSVWTAVAAAAPFAYITNSGSANILVIDTATETGMAPIALPPGTTPYGVAVSPDGSRVYVTHFAFTGKLFAVDVATNTVLASPAVGMFPFGVAVHPSGNKIFVTAVQNGGKLVVVDATTFSVTSFPTGNPRGLDVHPDGSKIYVTDYFNDLLNVLDANTLSPMPGSPIAVGVSPIGVAVSADGKRVYVTNEDSGSVSVIDTATNAVVATVEDVGINPVGVTVTPDNARVYVANSLSNSVSVIDATSLPLPVKIGEDIPVGNFPYGISNDGAQVYVALVNDNKVVVIDRAKVEDGVPANEIVKEFAATVPIAFGQFIRPPSRIDTALALSVEPAEMIVGSSDAIILRATLTRKDSGAGIDGGTVTFSIEGKTLGSAVTASGGVATRSFSAPGMTAGAHTVAASFAESVIGGLTYGASSASASLRVVFQFSGWDPPVAGGGVMNSANGGQTIPIKWTLSDANGNVISSLKAVVKTQTAPIPNCASDGLGDLRGAVGELRVDGASGRFQFNWKTEKEWAGTCRAFVLTLADGTVRRANFQFK